MRQVQVHATEVIAFDQVDEPERVVLGGDLATGGGLQRHVATDPVGAQPLAAVVRTEPTGGASIVDARERCDTDRPSLDNA